MNPAPFRPKRYGIGWEPATATGWAITLGFLLVVVAPALVPGWLDAGWGGVAFGARVATITAGFLLLCRRLSEPEKD